MSSVAVVILNYNGRAYLEQFLPLVVQYSKTAQVVVIDNGSTDTSLEFLRKFPSVQLVESETNRGFCGGYNYGLAQVTADYFVLLNSDVEVTRGWLEPMWQLLDQRPDVAAVQPKILSHAHRDHFEYAGAAGGMIDALGYPFCRGRLFDTVEKDEGQFNDAVPIFWATGACMMIRSNLYRQMGGLDEDFFAHMEEIDLCWKLKRDGHAIYYVGTSTVFHVGGGTLNVENPRKTYYNFRNGLSLLVKHVPSSQLVWKFPLRLMLDWVAAIRMMSSGFAHTWAVVRAHAFVLGHLGKLLHKRSELRRTLKGYNVSEVYPHILVFRFFLMGRKSYRALFE